MTYSQPGPALPGPVAPDPTAAQLAQDRQHLELLSIFHYVLGVMAGLVACFPIFHVVMGIAMAAGGFAGDLPRGEALPMQLVGMIFAGFGTAIILLGWALAIVILINGRFLARRERYRFCLVASAAECFFTPFGTVLGILTLIVLARPTVKSMFETSPPSPDSLSAPPPA